VQFSYVANICISSVTGLKGGQKAVVDFSNSMKELQVDIRKFPQTEAGFLDYTQTVMRRVLALKNAGQIDRADKLSIDTLGASLRVIGPSLELFIRDREALRQELIKSGQLVSEDDKKGAREYADALKELTNACDGLRKWMTIELAPFLSDQLSKMKHDLDEMVASVKTAIYWFNYAKGLAQQAGAAIGSVRVPGATTEPTTAGGFASGGMIRGPGSATSDSILARLSNGEFVLNAASVRRLGVGFLQGLNNFAAGGLVGAPPIRFAAGGLASASGGRAVHLHLGSQSFALSGSAGVVDALVSEAHWQQTRSAGVKPSWFAGRPSGR
jgi:hypothetical protein